MDSASTLGAALIATLLEGRSKASPLAAHGGRPTTTALRVALLPRMPEILRAFALIPTTVWWAEVLRAETTMLLVT